MKPIEPGATCWFIPEGFECEVVREYTPGEFIEFKNPIDGLLYRGKVKRGGWEINKPRRTKERLKTGEPIFIDLPFAMTRELIRLDGHDENDNEATEHDKPKEATTV